MRSIVSTAILSLRCKTNVTVYYISNYDIPEGAMKDSLLKQNKEAKNAKLENYSNSSSNLSHIAATLTLPHYFCFNALFRDKKIENDVLDEKRADVNFISISFLYQIKKFVPFVVSATF